MRLLVRRLARFKPLQSPTRSFSRLLGRAVGGSRTFGPVSALADAPVPADECTFLPVSWHAGERRWSAQAPRPPLAVELEPRGFEQPTGVYRLPRGRLAGEAGATITNRDRLVRPLSVFFAPNVVWSEHEQLRTVTLPALTRHARRAASLASVAGGNYYHWLADGLPRLALLTAAGIAPGSLDEIWIGGPARPFHFETLGALGLPAERVRVLDHGSHEEFDELLVPARACYPTGFADWSLAFLRDELRSKLLAQAGTEATPRRIYLTRRDAEVRRVENEAELLDRLARHGFTAVTLTGMPVSAQARLFHQAEAIVAPHGAGLANLVFAQPGCRVLELQPDHTRPGFYVHLAEKIGLTHRAWVSPIEYPHACPSFPVDVAAVDALVAEMLGVCRT